MKFTNEWMHLFPWLVSHHEQIISSSKDSISEFQSACTRKSIYASNFKNEPHEIITKWYPWALAVDNKKASLRGNRFECTPYVRTSPQKQSKILNKETCPTDIMFVLNKAEGFFRDYNGHFRSLGFTYCTLEWWCVVRKRCKAFCPGLFKLHTADCNRDCGQALWRCPETMDRKCRDKQTTLPTPPPALLCLSDGLTHCFPVWVMEMSRETGIWSWAQAWCFSSQNHPIC